MVLGLFRGEAVIVSGPGRSRPSQLISGVRPTVGVEHEEVAPGGTTAREAFHSDGAAAAPHNLSVLPSTAYSSAVVGVA